METSNDVQTIEKKALELFVLLVRAVKDPEILNFIQDSGGVDPIVWATASTMFYVKICEILKYSPEHIMFMIEGYVKQRYENKVPIKDTDLDILKN